MNEKEKVRIIFASFVYPMRQLVSASKYLRDFMLSNSTGFSTV